MQTESVKPVRAAVVGWPIKHSRSPLIHNYWLEKHNANARYDKLAVPPGEFPSFMANLKRSGLLGCNVTIPHKVTAYEEADLRLPEAEAVGAANTLWLEGGKICATNTDTYGFMTHLAEVSPNWLERDGPVAVFGAGGGARGIVYGLLQAGVERVHLINRTRAAADELASAFGHRIKVYDWGQRQQAIHGAACLINTTALGMTPNPPLPIHLDHLAIGATVADLVYVPLDTPLLIAARARGYIPVDGLGMLLHQAAPAFEKWFGIRPSVTPELRAHIVADLEAE